MAENILDKIPYEKIWAVPPLQRWLIVCGVIFLFFVAYYYVSYQDSVEVINKLVSNREDLKTKYEGYAKYVKRMPQLQRDIDELNFKLRGAKVQLPVAREIPELLTLISDTGTNTGLEFLLFKPFPEKKVDFYSKVPVEMVIVGSFHNVLTFFDKVKKMPRIVDISNVKIKSKTDKGGKVSLTTSCTATTYKYLEKAILQPKPKKKKK